MRIKRGTTKRRRHNKILSLTKGYRMSYSRLYRRAKEAVLHAGQYNYAHRRARRGQIRSEWIETISKALSTKNLSYNKLIAALKAKNVELDRKVLSEIIINNPAHFDKIVEAVM